MSYRLADLAEARVLEYLGGALSTDRFPLDESEVRLLLPLDRVWKLAGAITSRMQRERLSELAARHAGRFTGTLAVAVGWAVQFESGEDLEALQHELEAAESTPLPVDSGLAIPRAVSSVFRLYFWMCAHERRRGAALTIAEEMERDDSLAGLANPLYRDLGQTAQALDLLQIGERLLFRSHETGAASTQLNEIATVLKRLASLESRRAEYVRAAENIANASQACAKAMRYVGFEGETLEDASHIDVGALSHGNSSPTRFLDSHRRIETIRNIRASVLEHGGSVRSDLQRDAALLLSLMRTLSVAQVTGFIRNPIGVDDGERRAFRQIKDHLRLPFVFLDGPDGLNCEGSPSEDDRERRFLETLRVTWPARSGVRKSALRSMFSGVGIDRSERESWVFVPDGEVTFAFLLAVLSRLKGASPEARGQWIRGKPLSTKFVPHRPPAVDTSAAWLAPDLWAEGSLDDLLRQSGLIDSKGVATGRAHSLGAFLRSAVSTAAMNADLRRAAAHFINLQAATLQDYRKVFSAAVSAYLGSSDVLEFANVQAICRVGFLPEMILRLSPDYEQGEIFPRTLFFIVTQWDFDGHGKRDLPGAFMGGTLLETGPQRACRSEAFGKLVLLQQALSPLMNSALSQVLVEGASQKTLTERERSLRLQIAHTLNNGIMLTGYQFGAQVDRITSPLLRFRDRAAAGSENVMALLNGTQSSVQISEQLVKARRRSQASPPEARPPEWTFDLVEQMARTGEHFPGLRERVSDLAQGFADAASKATERLSRLTDVSRVLARLSETRFHAEFTATPDGSSEPLLGLVNQAFVECALLVLERASLKREHSKFTALKTEFGLVRKPSATRHYANASDPVLWGEDEVRRFLSTALGDRIDVSWACPTDVWVKDVDGALVAREMIRELTTNGLRALRLVNGRGYIGLRIVADERGILELEWRNTTDAANGHELTTRARGGQGVRFIGECAAALVAKFDGERSIDLGFDDARMHAIVRLRSIEEE